MRIESVTIKNYRVFKEETFGFDPYCCLVGANGAGKSTVLCALNVFFREPFSTAIDVAKLKDEDFYNRDTSSPIEITVTFTDLTEQAKEDLKDYVRQNKLVITAKAEYDPATEEAEVKQYGQRMGIRAFARFFEADKEKATVADLKVIYEDFRRDFPDLPAQAVKARMFEALHEYENSHPDLAEMIPSEDQFYGVSRGVNRLERHIQWVYVPAVKDASTEELEAKSTALGKLLTRTVRARVSFEEPLSQLRDEARNRYQTMLTAQQNVLNELSDSLNRRLIEWAHPEARLAVEWAEDPVKSVKIDEPYAQVKAGEGAFLGRIARLGHGLQRSFLLAILHELSGSSAEGGPSLVLTCEEPELYQHPPQIRHMSEVLRKLTTQGSQVIVTTHSPYFVGGRGFESVRLVRRDRRTGPAKVHRLSYADLSVKIAAAKSEPVSDREEGVLAKIHQELQPSINEIFFSPILILVEGLEDQAYITTYINLLGQSDRFKGSGCNIVYTNGKSHLLQPLIIAKHLCVPTFLVFDSDSHQPDRNGSRRKHEIDNTALLGAMGYSTESNMPTDAIWKPDMVLWHSELGVEIVGDFDPNALNSILDSTRIEYGQIGGLEKNVLFISSWLEKAWQSGMRSPKLERLCNSIIAFAVNGGNDART